MSFNKTGKSARRKSFLLLFSLGLILLFAIGGTVAFLVTQTGDVQNTFLPSKVTCDVEESFDGDVKTDVSIKNTGDTPAYIRAYVVVTWKDQDGNIYGGDSPVLGTNYSMTLTTDTTNWFAYTDGYYYYTAPVAAGENTEVLISECRYLGGAPEGYSLSVEILADAIQSEPPDAAGKAWGVKFNNNAVEPYGAAAGE